MNTLSLKSSSWRRSSAWARGVALVSLAAGAWAMTMGTAHARGDRDGDVYWSVGVSQPGVSVGVSNMPPPRVVVVQPRPVIVEQRPVVIERPVRYEQRVVVVREPVYYRDYGPRWHKRHDRRWKVRHGHRHDYRYDDRYDHRDDRDDDGRRGGGRR
jgi:hypothetical protein